MIHTVVHYIDSRIYGGCEQVVYALMSGLDQSRWRPVLVFHEAPEIAKFVKDVEALGISTRAAPAMSGQSRFAAIYHLVQTLRATGPTIFHAHLNWPLGCRFGVIAAKVGRVPAIVATSHLMNKVEGVRFGRLKHWAHAAMIDQYIAVSNSLKNELCRNLGVSEAKVSVVPNGIRLAPFREPADASLREQLTKGRDLPLVFTPARLHAQKGHAFLLQAAALVPDAIFLLAGDGPERSALERLCRQIGLEDRVIFLGQRDDVPRLLASCDLFVLPSLFEGMPLSVIEAMAAGKPVVATAVGGTNEIVVDGSTGVLTPPMDAPALASAIRAMLADRAMSARMGEAGRERAIEMFSAEAMVRRVAEVYDEVLAHALR